MFRERRQAKSNNGCETSSIDLNASQVPHKKTLSPQNVQTARHFLFLSAIFLVTCRLEGKLILLDRHVNVTTNGTSLEVDPARIPSSISTFGRHPQQILYEPQTNLVQPLTPSQLPPLRNIYESLPPRLIWETYDPEDNYDDGCHFQNPNYKQLYLSCPSMHEIDMRQMSFINCGGTRCAFHLPDSDPTNDRRVVLKLLGAGKSYKASRWERAQMDGLVMEQATSSPYIATVYGTCGVSQLLEYSSKGTLHDLIKVSRQVARDNMSPTDKLKLLIHVASAITDLHQVGAVHGDLSPNQFIHLDGIYKLNDFHISMFLREDDNQQICFDAMGFSSDNYIIHAPEERDRNEVDLSKADVYVMGHVMFNVYAKTWLYEGIMEDRALDMLYAGNYTPFPTNLDTAIPANAAMQSAILQSWTHNPEQRPSARTIRDFLLKALSEITGRVVKPGDKSLKVKVDSLPEDHRYTGTSMDEANVGHARKPRHVDFNSNQQ